MAGEPYATPSGEGANTRPANAAAYDPDAFRALVAPVMCLALPQDVLTRPDIQDILRLNGDRTPSPFPGPDRQQLIRLLGAS